MITGWMASKSTIKIMISRRAATAHVGRQCGLLATGSSDYHGIGKLDHELGCNTTDPEVFNEMQRRLAQVG